MKKTKERTQQRAQEMHDKLSAWLPEALKKNERTARKVACIVWYDKISNSIISSQYIIETIRDTPLDLDFDMNEVVATLVETFGYEEKFAKWRMGGRSLQ